MPHTPKHATSSELAITGVDRWLVRVPLKNDIVWASGVRSGVTRLVVRVTTRGGTIGWGETICLLDAIPAVLALPPADIERYPEGPVSGSPHSRGAP